MPYYHKLGRIPDKRHVAFRKEVAAVHVAASDHGKIHRDGLDDALGGR